MKKLFYAFIALSLAFTACQPNRSGESERQCGRARAAVCSAESCCKSESMTLNTFEAIQLLPPCLNCRVSLMTAMKNRRSDREFEERNLSLKHLSNILWAANGVNREDGRRTVPVAMGIYSIDTYVFLANGIFFYDPAAHKLLPFIEGDFRHLTGTQEFVSTAPLNLVFIANFHQYIERNVPRERWLYFAAANAGHSSQNVYLYAAAAGLRTVVRASVREQELLDQLGLDSNMNQFILAQTVGY